MTDSPKTTGGGSPPRTPGWVKVSAIIVGVLVLLFLGLRIFGHGGGHAGGGDGGHTSGCGTPPASVTPAVHQSGGGHR
jgi:hypothetical protein